jgi:hypothetical protein
VGTRLQRSSFPIFCLHFDVTLIIFNFDRMLHCCCSCTSPRGDAYLFLLECLAHSLNPVFRQQLTASSSLVPLTDICMRSACAGGEPHGGGLHKGPITCFLDPSCETRGKGAITTVTCQAMTSRHAMQCRLKLTEHEPAVRKDSSL